MANEVTKTKTTAISKESADQFQQMANIGFEEVNTDDLAIPFVRILQSTSKQVKKYGIVEARSLLADLKNQVKEAEQRVEQLRPTQEDGY